ncbi:hypothetical protein PVAP13_4KG396100 [Panicum virgatum]|uniref:E3 ubiquitin-protein ligase ARIH1-like UBA-like domain-containing protein n=1 Tax=Panicum virgatum TaxID=38727 RepID=A0A8T0TG25_PANVG|nr:hypothetical protein PVAP13_4KG396100 [Panicum virgatum]
MPRADPPRGRSTGARAARHCSRPSPPRSARCRRIEARGSSNSTLRCSRPPLPRYHSPPPTRASSPRRLQQAPRLHAVELEELAGTAAALSVAAPAKPRSRADEAGSGGGGPRSGVCRGGSGAGEAGFGGGGTGSGGCRGRRSGGGARSTLKLWRRGWPGSLARRSARGAGAPASRRAVPSSHPPTMPVAVPGPGLPDGRRPGPRRRGGRRRGQGPVRSGSRAGRGSRGRRLGDPARREEVRRSHRGRCPRPAGRGHAEVAEVLSVPPGFTAALLRHFRWGEDAAQRRSRGPGAAFEVLRRLRRVRAAAPCRHLCLCCACAPCTCCLCCLCCSLVKNRDPQKGHTL